LICENFIGIIIFPIISSMIFPACLPSYVPKKQQARHPKKTAQAGLTVSSPRLKDGIGLIILDELHFEGLIFQHIQHTYWEHNGHLMLDDVTMLDA
jgi:hypothetical protein